MKGREYIRNIPIDRILEVIELEDSGMVSNSEHIASCSWLSVKDTGRLLDWLRYGDDNLELVGDQEDA